MTDTVTWGNFIATIGIFVGIVGSAFAVIGLFIRSHSKYIDDFNEKIARHDERIINIGDKLRPIEATNSEFIKNALDLVNLSLSKNTKGNPYQAEERDRLLNKYRSNSLTLNEANRLKEILEEEKRIAMRTNPWLAFAIGMLIGGLAGLIIGLAATSNKNSK